MRTSTRVDSHPKIGRGCRMFFFCSQQFRSMCSHQSSSRPFACANILNQALRGRVLFYSSFIYKDSIKKCADRSFKSTSTLLPNTSDGYHTTPHPRAQWCAENLTEIECTYQYSVDLTRIDGYAIVWREIVINGTFYKSSLEIALLLLMLARKLQKDGMSVEWI